MTYNKKQIIRESIMAAIRNGKKQTTIGDLVVSVDYKPQLAGTVTQQWLYFEKWLNDKIDKTADVIRHRIK
tara:strand:- start:10 stop:222 length:213 start_codon:yes stop_codon:yes gene_type:complete